MKKKKELRLKEFGIAGSRDELIVSHFKGTVQANPGVDTFNFGIQKDDGELLFLRISATQANKIIAFIKSRLKPLKNA